MPSYCYHEYKNVNLTNYFGELDELLVFEWVKTGKWNFATFELYLEHKTKYAIEIHEDMGG